jgi:hypothetical protein
VKAYFPGLIDSGQQPWPHPRIVVIGGEADERDPVTAICEDRESFE